MLTRVSDWECSTGTTGYVGGTVLDTLVKCNAGYNITVLMRNNVPEGFTERYPNVQIVHGEFNDEELIADTAAKNEIVIRN